MVCCVSGCVRAPHHGLSAPAVARYWGYLRSANTPLIVRSSLNLWVPVLLLVLAPVVFRSPLWLRRIPPVDLAAHCVPVPIFHQRCAQALNLPATLFDLSINCCLSLLNPSLDFLTQAYSQRTHIMPGSHYFVCSAYGAYFSALMLTDQSVLHAVAVRSGPVVRSRSGVSAAVQRSFPHRVYLCYAARTELK